METLTGSVERITFYNPENGYTVLRLQPDQKRLAAANAEGLITVTGSLPELSPGEHLRLSGEWVSHPKHGLQFDARVCEQTLPADLAGIRRYLGSGLVKGIGPRLAERIVAQFGVNTLEIIETHPERLEQVPDIGRKRAQRIAAAWEEQKQIKDIMLFLHSHGVTTGLAVRIYRHYGPEALEIVRSDPYRLARDVHGIGFKTADGIARALGLKNDHPTRIEAGVIYALNQAADDGHVYLPQTELVAMAAELLEIDPEATRAAVERVVQAGLAHAEQIPFDAAESPTGTVGRQIGEGSSPGYARQAVYLTPLYRSEIGTADRLRCLVDALPGRLSDLPPAFTPILENLSVEQKTAVHIALSHPVSILTGGPGTGKTTTLKALIDAVEAAGKRFALASPTGRAAKRLSQATDRPAATIHRLLNYKPGEGFRNNASNPLELDLVVIDEASMIDLHLAYNLFKALPDGAHLVLVGDVDQLPSVGAGDVLRDIIASGAAPVTRLTEVFRQAAHSNIITNAHRINQGQMPVFPSAAGASGDFFLFPAETPEEASRWVLEVVTRRIPQKFSLHPLQDIQVLSPMYRGPAGVNALNESLQAALNPPQPGRAEKKLYGRLFRAGDKLMQTQNNYDKEVFNGDIGLLVGVDLVEHTLDVDFEGRILTFDWSEADQLAPAYAVSVHKAQGAEYPAVVIPLVTQHYMMLQRNLIYTAVTRARRLCVLIGSRRAIAMAVRNNRIAERHTGLDWRLKQRFL